MAKLSEIRAAVEAYAITLNDYDEWSNSDRCYWDDVHTAEKLMVDIFGEGEGGKLPYPFGSEWDRRPLSDAGRKMARLMMLAQEVNSGQLGEYGALIDYERSKQP